MGNERELSKDNELEKILIYYRTRKEPSGDAEDLITALQSYMRRRVDLLELANKNANAALADKCDEFGRYVKASERKVLEGKIESIEKCKLVKDETAKPSNKDMVCIQMTATVPSISIEVMSLFYETHTFTLELMQKALEQKLKSEEGY